MTCSMKINQSMIYLDGIRYQAYNNSNINNRRTIAKQLLFEVGGVYYGRIGIDTVRVDKALKQEVTEIYESLGMDLPTTLRMFMSKSKMVIGVPFEVRILENAVTRAESMRAFEDLRVQTSNLSEMALEEINAEILAVRIERKKR